MRIIANFTLLMAALAAASISWLSGQSGKAKWLETFSAAKADLASKGNNRYFVLRSGYRLELQGGGVRLLITVLNGNRAGGRRRVVRGRGAGMGRRAARRGLA